MHFTTPVVSSRNLRSVSVAAQRIKGLCAGSLPIIEKESKQEIEVEFWFNYYSYLKQNKTPFRVKTIHIKIEYECILLVMCFCRCDQTINIHSTAKIYH